MGLYYCYNGNTLLTIKTESIKLIICKHHPNINKLLFINMLFFEVLYLRW